MGKPFQPIQVVKPGTVERRHAPKFGKKCKCGNGKDPSRPWCWECSPYAKSLGNIERMDGN